MKNLGTQDFEATYTDFTVYDSDNNEVKLSDYEGKPVMVLFWNSEEKDSVEMLKRLDSQYEKYKNKIEFLAINTKEETSDLDITMPIYFDLDKDATKKYNIEKFPTMLYINKENEVFNSKVGLTTSDALEANLDILAENF